MNLRTWAAGWLTLAALAVGGCASVPASNAAGGNAAATPTLGQNPVDPWEAFNRKVFAFNEVLDDTLLKPVAQAYRSAVPELVRRGVDNVLGNIGDVWSAANQLLQGKVEYGLNMGMRVLTNSFFGLGGLLDPATEMGLIRRSEDFGQTLGHWGIGPGPYIVLPLLGPRTARDTAALSLDLQADASRLPPTSAGRSAVTVLTVVSTRANLLATTQLLDQAALDKYLFVRDAYLSRRQDQVYDGAAPMEKFEDEPDSAAQPSPKK